MNTSPPLSTVLKELGQEDWIPVPEAVHSPEVLQAVDSGAEPGAAIVQELSRLVEADEVRLSRGRALSPSPSALSADEALRLLDDPHWRGWGREHNEERLFFTSTSTTTPATAVDEGPRRIG